MMDFSQYESFNNVVNTQNNMNTTQNLLDQVLTVSQLTDIIKELLEGGLPSIVLEGEVSNYRPSSTGHAYFTLKDQNAAISAVMFKGKMRNLTFSPKDGMVVQVKGQISVYAQRGSYQIIVDSMEEAGSGNILQILEERKRRLALEGLFDSENKRPLPFFPTTIGVVTSPTGAALRDILQIVTRRNPKISVIVLPCPVQGNDAGPQIAQQIITANNARIADVLIVGRGGGSLEDLLPFSDECVVRAVAASEIPIVSAVGHEIDWALSDFAADVRAPTPSAAAELCTPLLSDIKDTINTHKDNLLHTMENKVEHSRLLIKNFSAESLEMRFRTIEQPYLTRFDDAKDALLRNMTERCTNYRHRIQNAVVGLDASNPQVILSRGYAMVRDKNTGAIIRNSKSLLNGQLLEIIPESGKITASVVDTE